MHCWMPRSPLGLNLPRRQGERAIAKQMYMQMRHTFTSVGSTVDHDAIATRQIQLLRDIARNEEQFSEQRAVAVGRLCEPRYHSFWYDQHMHGRLRIDVVERDRVIVFPNDFRRSLAGDDFFKNGHDDPIICKSNL